MAGVIEIVVVAFGTPAFEQLAEIRRRVFVDEQGVSADHEFDALESTATHFLARCDGAPCGAARLYGEGGMARIGRVAVLPAYRQCGVGRALMVDAMEVARQQGFTEVLIHSQTRAAGFYSRLGFVAEGAPFMEEGIPHMTMTCRLDNPSSGS